MASKSVAEITGFYGRENTAAWISNLWDDFNSQRAGKIEEWKELRNYIYATDTHSTSNGALPHKNSVTLPKLTHIRDNLHSNYLSALFPNDQWLYWEGYSKEDSVKEKRKAIQSYMSNKTRESNFRSVVSQLLYDYIDYGNCFVMPAFESSYKEMADGKKVPSYIGPVAQRISPLDIVFDPLASSFEESYKVVRSIHTIGSIKKIIKTFPEEVNLQQILKEREGVIAKLGGYRTTDVDKALGFSVDGFGDIMAYFRSNYIELLTFYGDYYDAQEDVLYENKKIVVMDRTRVISVEDIPSWLGHSPIYHVGWRLRQDNLWAMGPMDNLVGMQYRMDHLENLKDDAMDLLVEPPLVIIGEVEQFTYAPGEEIHVDEGGQIVELGKNAQGVVAAASEIQQLEARMELYAGAPREAMGFRTPGEKTAFEVQSLENASSRIFQEKITQFEVLVLEKLLNGMLETASRNMEASDLIRVMDNDLGVTQFMEITKADITANGILRPIGARHFGKKAQDLQNVMGVLGGGGLQLLQPHISTKALSQFINEVLGIDRYEIFKENVAIFEQQETQRLVNQAQEDLMVETSQIPGA